MAGHASRSRSQCRRPELGQHFLAGGRLAIELVEQAGVGPADLVVEIGAGTGVLTLALARRAGRVLAVERDPLLAATARRRLAGLTNVTVVTADALRLPLPRRPFRVVANLPFGSTAAILRRLLDDPRSPLQRADLIVQEQAARRYAAATPATRGRSAGAPGTSCGSGAACRPPASARRRGSPPPSWSSGAGVRRWSGRRTTAVWRPCCAPASGTGVRRCGAPWCRRSAAASCGGSAATSASRSTPAPPTSTPASGPGSSRSSGDAPALGTERASP